MLKENERLEVRLALHPRAKEYMAAQFSAWIQDPDRILVVAEENGRVPVGYAAGRVGPGTGWHKPLRIGEITDCFVVPPRRRRGIARRMVGRLMDLLYEKDTDTVRCRVVAANEASLAFWRSMGWDDSRGDPREGSWLERAPSRLHGSVLRAGLGAVRGLRRPCVDDHAASFSSALAPQPARRPTAGGARPGRRTSGAGYGRTSKATWAVASEARSRSPAASTYQASRTWAPTSGLRISAVWTSRTWVGGPSSMRVRSR